MYEKNVRNDDITKNFIFLNNKKITVLEINMKSVLTFLDDNCYELSFMLLINNCQRYPSSEM